MSKTIAQKELADKASIPWWIGGGATTSVMPILLLSSTSVSFNSLFCTNFFLHEAIPLFSLCPFYTCWGPRAILVWFTKVACQLVFHISQSRNSRTTLRGVTPKPSRSVTQNTTNTFAFFARTQRARAHINNARLRTYRACKTLATWSWVKSFN